MWEKRATSAEGKTIRIAESSDMDSWKALLDHVLKSLLKMCKVEMLLPNYTKWSGMSCGGKKTMTSRGREKGGVLEISDKNGDIP